MRNCWQRRGFYPLQMRLCFNKLSYSEYVGRHIMRHLDQFRLLIGIILHLFLIHFTEYCTTFRIIMEELSNVQEVGANYPTRPYKNLELHYLLVNISTAFTRSPLASESATTASSNLKPISISCCKESSSAERSRFPPTLTSSLGLCLDACP